MTVRPCRIPSYRTGGQITSNLTLHPELDEAGNTVIRRQFEPGVPYPQFDSTRVAERITPFWLKIHHHRE